MSSKQNKSPQIITLDQAIEFGEYDPDYLSRFSDWERLSRHIQLEMIKKALDNRRRQLVGQYAELNNVLDFSKKDYLKNALKNIENQLKKLEEDREKIYLVYIDAA